MQTLPTGHTLEAFIDLAIKEDIGNGDHTSLSCIPVSATNTATLIMKQDGVIAGIELSEMIFHRFDKNLKIDYKVKDGAAVKKGDIVFTVTGSSQNILMAERIVLNFMQRMSGIATKTRAFADAIKDYPAFVLDTRKTTPLLRAFEKWAVLIGGGMNHRHGLYDMVMIKDNHVDFAGGIAKAVALTMSYLKEKNLDIPVEVETRNLDEVKQALDAPGVTRIMLDNFTPEETIEAVDYINGQVETEASGNMNLTTVAAYAAAGVDFISVGALTHSAGILDMSLTVIK